MEPDWIESDAIWDSLPGAFDVWRLYGLFPSMRDAVIRRIDVGYEDRSLRLDLLCAEPTRDGGEPLKTRVVLEWSGVVEATIGLEERYLYDMFFAREGDLLRATLNQPSHISRVLARSARIALVEIPSDDDLAAMQVAVR